MNITYIHVLIYVNVRTCACMCIHKCNSVFLGLYARMCPIHEHSQPTKGNLCPHCTQVTNIDQPSFRSTVGQADIHVPLLPPRRRAAQPVCVYRCVCAHLSLFVSAYEIHVSFLPHRSLCLHMFLSVCVCSQIYVYVYLYVWIYMCTCLYIYVYA